MQTGDRDRLQERVNALEVERAILARRCAELEAAGNRRSVFEWCKWPWKALRWIFLGPRMTHALDDAVATLNRGDRLSADQYSGLASALVHRVIRVRAIYVLLALVAIVPPTVTVLLHAKQIASETWFSSHRFLIEPLLQCRSSIRTLRQLVGDGASVATCSEVLEWTRKRLIECNAEGVIAARTLALMHELDPRDTRPPEEQCPGFSEALLATEGSLSLVAASRGVDIADALDDYFGFIRINSLEQR